MTIGDFSMELCGGTHLDNTAKTGMFRIKSESSVASGVRRIEATTGKVSLEETRHGRTTLLKAAQFFKTAPGSILERMEQQANEMKELRQVVEKFKAEASLGEAKQVMASAKAVGGLHIITSSRQGLDANALRTMGDFLRDKDPAVVAVLASITGEKVSFLAVCGKEAVAKGIALVREQKAQGVTLLATGEMGIGNTTTSSAVAAVLLAQPVQTMTGRGAGLSDAGLARKVDTIRRGIACNNPDPDDALDVLRKLGGFDIAGLCGMFLGGALAGVPVLMDGFISGVAALCAVRLCPAAAKAERPPNPPPSIRRCSLSRAPGSRRSTPSRRNSPGTGSVRREDLPSTPMRRWWRSWGRRFPPPP